MPGSPIAEAPGASRPSLAGSARGRACPCRGRRSAPHPGRGRLQATRAAGAPGGAAALAPDRGYRSQRPRGWPAGLPSRARTSRPGQPEWPFRARTIAGPMCRRSPLALPGRSGRDPFDAPLEALGWPGLAAQRTVLAVTERVVGLDEGMQLAGPLVDHRRFGVAQVALDGELVAVAVRAVDLDRVQGGLDRMLRGVPLGEAGLAGVAPAVVLQPAGSPHEEAPRLRATGHVGQHLLDELVVADLLAKRLPLAGVRHGCVQGGLAETDGPRRNGVAALVDRAHRDEEALALLAHAILQRHLAVVEVDDAGVAGSNAELAVQRRRGEAAEPPLDDEGRDGPMTLRPVQRGEDEEVVGDVRQADPDLLAVEDVAVAAPSGRRLECAGVRAHPGLGEPERGELFAPRLGHEVALALVLAPPLEEGEGIEADVDALQDAESRVRPLELLAQDGEADVIHAGTAVALGNRGAEEAQLAHPGEDLAVDLAARVPVANVGQDLRLGEGAGALLDEPVLVREREVDHGCSAADASVGRHSRPPVAPIGHRLYSAGPHTRACWARRDPPTPPTKEPRDRHPGRRRRRPRGSRAAPFHAGSRTLFRADLEPRRRTPPVRHGRQGVPRLRQRHRGFRPRSSAPGGHRRDPRAGR